MRFKNWYVLNEVRVAEPVEFKKKLLKNGNVPFYVNEKGEIVIGYATEGGSFRSYFTLNTVGKYRSLETYNVQPTSKIFKDVIAALRPFVPDIDDYGVGTTHLGHAVVGRKDNRNRQVRFYLGHENTDFSPAKMPKYLYHGTCTELWYEGIKTQGLLPRKLNKIGGSGSYGSANIDSLSHDDKIYLATHPDSACRLAATQAASKHGGQPLILRITTDGLFPEKFVQDEDYDQTVGKINAIRAKAKQRPQIPAQISQVGMGAVSYVGRIPPSNIAPLSTKKDISVPGGQWFPFKDVERSEHPLTAKLNGRGVDSYDSPYFYALLDAGLGTEDADERSIKGEGIPDSQVRELIKKSPWVMDAVAIAKDVNNFGMEGIKSLVYVELPKVPKNLKWATDMLVGSRLYYDEKGYLSRCDSWRPTKKIIALAKMLHQGGKTYKELLKAVAEIDRVAR